MRVGRFGTELRGAAVDAGRVFVREHMMDRAAALTYYSVLSIFPGLLVLVSVLGMLSPAATRTLVANIERLAPQDVADTLSEGILGLQQSRGAAGVLAIVGLAGALWSASGYTGAFMRASNVIFGVAEGRPWWKVYGLRIGITVAVGVLLVLALASLAFTGRFAQLVGEAFGAGGTVATVWGVARWPLLLFVVSLILAILYWASPNARVGRIRLISAGGIVAVVAWVAVSAGFALYVANFASYNRTYGALGGVIAFLVWLWVSNNVVLYGAVLNARLLARRGVLNGDGTAAPRQERGG
ncbi:YihY/virulence factor BrkB family protein [Stackebrandtia soli]|uniref:YihY/virulence factor BrkB family protein n=1 Tax=Stackebrandtia soli TaxID=1892856 RepID=UPI0039ECD834